MLPGVLDAYGGSVGRRVMGIAVVRPDGAPLNPLLGALLLRPDGITIGFWHAARLDAITVADALPT